MDKVTSAKTLKRDASLDALSLKKQVQSQEKPKDKSAQNNNNHHEKGKREDLYSRETAHFRLTFSSSQQRWTED